MKNKRGFTLVEIIAAIAVIAIISILAAPNIIKKYNDSRIEAIAIQESKLVEAGDIFLEDHCKDAINSEYKQRCEIYYQHLDKSAFTSGETDYLVDGKEYKYICVDDIKKFDYYTEDIKFGGTKCHGVVIYEIDEITKMQSDSFSYVECGVAYPIEKTKKQENYRTLFSNCFPENDEDLNTDQNHENNKKYTLTVKYVENDFNGRQVKPTETYTFKNETDKITFTAPYHERNGNTYEAIINTGGNKDIVFEDLNPPKDSNQAKTYKVSNLPLNNLTITVIYAVEKHSIVTNYYRFDPTKGKPYHSSVEMNGKESTTKIGYTFEKVDVDIPQTIEETINGKKEKFNRINIFVDGKLDDDINNTFNGQMEIGKSDKNVEVVYQREAFNIKYENAGGTGCNEGRVKYLKNYGTLCTPTRKGYIFNYWSRTQNGEEITSATKFEEYNDITLYANWTPIQYKLVFNSNNANGKVEDVICTYDSSCILPNNSYTRTGHHFDKWYLNKSGTGTGYEQGRNIMNFTDKNETITFHAGWKTNKYYIAFKPGTGGSGTMSNMTMEYTKSKNLTSNTFTRTGYTFNNWSGSDGKTYENGQEVINLTTTNGATVNMTANWSINNYTVTIKSNNSSYGTVSTSSLNLPYGTTYTTNGGTLTFSNGTKVTATPKSATGYTTKISSWSPSSGTITSATTITANFTRTANTYTVTFNSNGIGTPSKSTMNVTYGSTYASLATISASGYTFLGWYTSASGGTQITNSTTVTTTSNQTLYAQWKLNNVLPQFTYTGSYQIVNDNDSAITTSNGNWKIRFLTSGYLTFTNLGNASSGIDVFLVGGGGGGAIKYGHIGGGGGGGYTITHRNIQIQTGKEYYITIGSGGAGAITANGGGGSGGTSSAFGYYAAGGKGNGGGGYGVGAGKGGNGGSGGGSGNCDGGVDSDGNLNCYYFNAGSGGSGGYNGGGDRPGSGQMNVPGPYGESGNTREFGESNGRLYAAGGGGGGYGTGSGGGAANTGGGGNGLSSTSKGQDGFSGIVIIRNKR